MSTTDLAPTPARHRSRTRFVAFGLALLVVVVAIVLGGRGGDAPPAMRDELAPQTRSFVDHHDAATAELASARDLVAAEEPSAEGLRELADVLEAAAERYAALPAPTWLEADVAAYLEAVEDERAATLDAYDALRSGDDPRDALRDVLDLRARADDLAASLRGTALVHPAGR